MPTAEMTTAPRRTGFLLVLLPDSVSVGGRPLNAATSRSKLTQYLTCGRSRSVLGHELATGEQVLGHTQLVRDIEADDEVRVARAVRQGAHPAERGDVGILKHLEGAKGAENG